MAATSAKSGKASKRDSSSAGQKAKRTGIWAKIMTKWFITYSNKGRKKWHFVSFEGRRGGESTGVVDFIAIRRNHHAKTRLFAAGDRFQIILIQVKGGGSKSPSQKDVKRLQRVKKYHHANRVLLSTWEKGKPIKLHELRGNDWINTTPTKAFK